jgi:hypothetical protein
MLPPPCTFSEPSEACGWTLGGIIMGTRPSTATAAAAAAAAPALLLR